MIKFKRTVESIVVHGDDPAFDTSELGEFPKEERAMIWFKIFPLTASLVKEINAKHTVSRQEAKFIDGRRVMEKVSSINQETANDELMDRVVEDWGGIVDEKGEVIACTKENKLMMADNYQGIGTSWIDVSRWAMARSMEESKEQEKNLKASQVGSEDAKVE